MTVGAGELRERVTFQSRSADANGDALGAWVDGSTRWARVRPRIGTEPVLQARLQGEQPIEVVVRDDTVTRQVSSTARLTWRGTAYEITAVAPLTPGPGFITLLAKAGGA